jgi:hypothetical protein
MENQIETQTSESLALSLQEQHRQIRVCEMNIQIILQELTARQNRHEAVSKEVDETNQKP